MTYWLYFAPRTGAAPYYRFESRVDLASASSNAYHYRYGCPHFQTDNPQPVNGARTAQREAKVTFQLNDDEIMAILKAVTYSTFATDSIWATIGERLKKNLQQVEKDLGVQKTLFAGTVPTPFPKADDIMKKARGEKWIKETLWCPAPECKPKIWCYHSFPKFVLYWHSIINSSGSSVTFHHSTYKVPQPRSFHRIFRGFVMTGEDCNSLYLILACGRVPLDSISKWKKLEQGIFGGGTTFNIYLP